jgi:hypothetical protein
MRDYVLLMTKWNLSLLQRQNGDEDCEDQAIISEACAIVGTATLTLENLRLPSRFRNRLNSIRRFKVKGPTDFCIDEISKFLLHSTMGTWSCWGTISKVEVFLPIPCLGEMTIVVCKFSLKHYKTNFLYLTVGSSNPTKGV